MKKIIFIVAIAAFFNIFAVDLVKNRQANAFILLEKNAPAPVRFAASEISAYAEKITGIPLPVLEGKNPVGKYMISFDLKPDSGLGTEGYRIKGTKESLTITGGSARAVLYGTYAFIEEFFGVRWFAPGELYEHVPIQKELCLPENIERMAKPEFSVRNMGFVRCNWYSDLSDSWKFLVRNRWQVKGNLNLRKKFSELYNNIDVSFSGGGHCLASLVSDSLFEKHPEYFALVKGKRIRQKDERGRAVSQPCTTHPEVINLAVKGITEFFDKAPRGSSYLIGNNDIPTWCECERCIALDTPEERKKGYVSTRFYTFINTVAKEVWKKHPDAKILGWGYQNYRFAPKGIKPAPGLRINLCDHQRCYRHSLLNMECKENEKIREMFLSWRAYQLPVSERGYQESLLRNGYFYLPIEYVIAEDLRYFKQIGVDGYRFITSPPDGVYRKSLPLKEADAARNAMYCLWPSIYICGKMFWDTSLDPEAVWEDAGSRFYGRAWPAMKEYRKLLREAYTETSGHIVTSNSPVDIGRSLQKPGVEKRLIALLKKAERLAADDPDKKVAKRVALEKKYFMETWIANARIFEKTQSKVCEAIRTSKPIVIDGILNEKEWQKTQYITGFSRNVAPPAVPADLFAKALFDQEFIYLSVTGTNPVENEKWIITFPDHNRLNAPLKTFDLDGKTPFVKAMKKRDSGICYELKIPRRLIRLSENSAALFLNIRRLQHNQVCAELYPNSIGGIALGKESLRNGNFSMLKPKPMKMKNGEKELFPAYWSLAGKGWKAGKECFEIYGTMYQFLTVSGGKNGGVLKVDVRCSPAGKSAFIQPYLSLDRKTSGDRGKFIHSFRKNGDKTVIKTNGIYHFTFKLEPYETGYIYLRGKNFSIAGIIAAFEENKEKQ